MPNRQLNICVMRGGPSAERDISLRSGAAAARALRSLGHEVQELDPVDEAWQLPVLTDVVFLALHGTYGEDGGVQTRLDELGVRYTGCGAAASRTAFDKVLTKKRCLSLGIPTPRFAVLASPTPEMPPDWLPPVVLKPVRQGSSIGLQMVNRAEDWEAAVADAFRYDTEILLEERIFGREATVGILGGRALPVAEIRARNGVFDYHSKYTAGAAEHCCPADFDLPTTAAIQTAALDAFRGIEGRDYARVDVMVPKDGRPTVLEVNTLPGLTELSILPETAAAAGITYPQLCQRMIDMAFQHPLTRIFQSR